MTFTFAATVPFLVLFAIGLARALSVSDGPSFGWGQVTIAGAILAGGVILAASYVHFALVDVGDRGDASAAALALNALEGSTWVAYNAGFGVMMLGAAGLLLGRAGAYRWSGRIALVLAILLFIPLADFFALLATLIWIVVMSIALARAKSEPAYVAAPAT